MLFLYLTENLPDEKMLALLYSFFDYFVRKAGMKPEKGLFQSVLLPLNILWKKLQEIILCECNGSGRDPILIFMNLILTR